MRPREGLKVTSRASLMFGFFSKERRHKVNMTRRLVFVGSG